MRIIHVAVRAMQHVTLLFIKEIENIVTMELVAAIRAFEFTASVVYFTFVVRTKGFLF